MRRVMVAVLFLTLAGCDALAPDPDPELVGNWHGQAEGITFTLNFQQTGTDVTGSGSLAGSSGTLQITANGTHHYPNVSFVIQADGYNDANFAGAFTDRTTVTGLLNGSGFTNAELVLTRQ